MTHRHHVLALRQIEEARQDYVVLCALPDHPEKLSRCAALEQIIDRLTAEIATYEAKSPPFSTYPEDRQKMLDLCKVIEDPKTSCYNFDKAAIELADLVKAILEDEQLAVEAEKTPSSPFSAPLDLTPKSQYRWQELPPSDADKKGSGQ